MALRALVIILASSLILSACGRRGSLEPPGTVEEPPLGAQDTLLDEVSPGGQEPAEATPAAAPDRPFLLDFLL
jgi:hypothetical protein